MTDISEQGTSTGAVADIIFTGGGEMGALMRAHDWSTSPLGSPETWPQSLRSAVGMMLPNKHLMFVAWGPELCFLYNDGYRPVFGAKHPRALGRPFREVWSEIWDDIKPLIDTAMSGGATWSENLPLVMERNGYPEEAWFTFSYSPLRDESGAITGMFCAGAETTQTLLAQAALRKNEGRLRFLGELDEALRKSHDAPEAMLAAATLLAQRLGASRTAYADVDADSDRFFIREDFTAPGIASSAGTYSLDLFGPRAAADMRAGQTLVVHDVPGELAPGEGRETFLSIGIGAIICCPLVRNGRLVAMMAVHQDVPRDWRDDEIALVETVVERCWAHVERVGAEARLRESEARFRNMADHAPAMMWVTDADGSCTYLNRAWYEFTGQGENEGEGFGWLEAVHPDDRGWSGETFMAANTARGPFRVEYRLRRHDGEPRWAIDAASPRFGPRGEFLGYIGSVIDIDERREMEDALRDTSQDQRRLIDELKHADEELRQLNETLEQRVAERTVERDRAWQLSQDLLVTARPDGVLVSVNARWTELLGWQRDELIGATFMELTHPDDLAATQAAFVDIFETPLTKPYEYRLRSKSGGYCWFAWTGAFASGYVYATGRDVTAEKEQAAVLEEAQDALRQSQKMEAVGQLTGGLAHDFNNLLTGIMGNLELIQKNVASGRFDSIDRFVNAAQGAGRRAAALTHRLLAFSRRQTLDPKPTDVNRLIAGMEELIRRSVGPAVDIEVVGAAGLWPTLIDAGQLENALLNLAINGRDAMPDGGRLTIETANRWLDGRTGRERDLPPGQYLSICVTDTGTGMTPEVIARAFDPFYTTKPLGEGTGLGLSMIYGFARQSGGQIRIYSEVGAGTTMCIYLPRHVGDEPEDAGDLESADALDTARGETILVIDDEPTIRHLIDEVLDEQGYTVIGAADGAAGLKVLQSGARIELLITDVGLPGGMNGRQVADAARVLRPGLKVLFITGYAENAAVGNGHLDLGMELLTKPFSLDDLARRVSNLITKRV